MPATPRPTTVQRARELLSEGDQGGGGSGIKILLAALAAAPGLQTLLADAVVHSQLARWTFKRSLLKCLEAAVLTTSDHRWVGRVWAARMGRARRRQGDAVGRSAHESRPAQAGASHASHVPCPVLFCSVQEGDPC